MFLKHLAFICNIFISEINVMYVKLLQLQTILCLLCFLKKINYKQFPNNSLSFDINKSKYYYY